MYTCDIDIIWMKKGVYFKQIKAYSKYYGDNILKIMLNVCFFEQLNVIIKQLLSKLGSYATWICLKEENNAAALLTLKTGDITYIYTNPAQINEKKTKY